MNFYYCPRCGWKSLERLKTYSYCINCNFNTVEDKNIFKRCNRHRKKTENLESKIDVARIKKIQADQK